MPNPGGISMHGAGWITRQDDDINLCQAPAAEFGHQNGQYQSRSGLCADVAGQDGPANPERASCAFDDTSLPRYCEESDRLNKLV
jgi:hypothetical protein